MMNDSRGRIRDDGRLLKAIRETMAATPYCMLVTVGRTGDLEARMMDTLEPEPDMSIWMGTDPTTRKARQLKADPRATLTFCDDAGLGYVTMIGRARLVSDTEERQRRWKDEWADFYPAGPTSDGFALLEFTPERIEAMSVAHELGSGPFEPTCLVRDGDGWVSEPPPDA